MDVGNLSAQQTAHEDLIAISYGVRCPEDCAPLLVSPPTAVYRLAGYGFGQSRSGSSTSFQYDTVLFNEPYRFHRRGCQRAGTSSGGPGHSAALFIEPAINFWNCSGLPGGAISKVNVIRSRSVNA